MIKFVFLALALKNSTIDTMSIVSTNFHILLFYTCWWHAIVVAPLITESQSQSKINTNKSFCMRIESRFDSNCAQILSYERPIIALGYRTKWLWSLYQKFTQI